MHSIIWSPKAKENYSELLQYVENNFGLDAALDLLEKTDKVIDGISLFPNMFPASTLRPEIRKANISKQTSLYYKVGDIEVKLLEFVDNRKDS